MDYITYADSIEFGNGQLSYGEDVTDNQIAHFLRSNDEITEDHPLIRYSEDPYETVQHLIRIIYQIKQLQEGKSLIPFEICYEDPSQYPDYPCIYDGWHRIRAYQYLKYEKIPCYISKHY